MSDRHWRSSSDAEGSKTSEDVHKMKLCASERIEVKSGGEGDLGTYSLNNSLYQTKPNQIILTECLDAKLYGNNRYELDALHSFRDQLNLSEISECDDSSDTENITSSRVQDITTREISRFGFLTQSETQSPPHKKLRAKSPSLTGSSVALKLVFPPSICDESSTEVSPQANTNESSEVISSIALKELPHKSDTYVNAVNVPQKVFHSSNRYILSPKILDLELLSSIHTTEADLACGDYQNKNWDKPTLNSDSTKSASAAETERLFPVNYNLLCTDLDVPLQCKPNTNFPAISKITTNIGNLGDSSSYGSSRDFRCINDTPGYSDVKLESPRDEPLDDDYVSYKDMCGIVSDKTVQNATASRPAVSNALLFRETQSIQLPYYDVASSSSSEDPDSITIVSESEDSQESKSNTWWQLLCFDFSFCTRK